MSFYYVADENVLEGNRLGQFTEVDGDEVVIDVEGIMAEGRGIDKLTEMVSQIETAIDANRDDNGGGA